MSKNTCWNFFIKPWLFQQPPETKLFTSVASVRGQNLACYVSFNISYSLVLWVKIWQIFIPMTLELLKTHHCAMVQSQIMMIPIKLGNINRTSLESRSWLWKIYLSKLLFELRCLCVFLSVRVSFCKKNFFVQNGSNSQIRWTDISNSRIQARRAWRLVEYN